MTTLTVKAVENKRNIRAKRLLGQLLLLLCSILVSLSAGELLLRRYYPIGETIYQLDSRYLHRFKPNSREIFRFSSANGGKKVLVTINRDGRRGDPVSMKRPRVLVYGDSFVSAVFCPIEQTFVWQLEQKLKSVSPLAPQVINCGVGGYGPDQESLVLEDEIDRLKPELVIVSIYAGNDFGDLLRNKIYKLDDKTRLVENSHTISPSLISLFSTPEQFPRFYTVRLLERAWQKVRDKRSPAATPATEGYMERWLQESVAEYKEYIIDGNDLVWNLFEDHYDADVSLDPNSESSRYKRILMDRVLERMKGITGARSIPLMLVIIPAPFDVVDNYIASVDSRRYPEYRRSELTDAVEQIAREEQLPYVNLFKPFREHGAASLYYVVDNDHWTPAGQRLAAGLVADYIKQHHLLDTPVGAMARTRQ